ncbi:MAG TPA: glutathione S-transferase family protein, partial [Caulobacteraceae bacterium]
MLTLWGRRSSINVQKVLWTLEETGVAFEHIELGGRFGGLNSAEFRARNPHGRIPVIDDDGVVVWESNAIVRYLAARYSPGALSPETLAGRAAADEWMDWCATALQPAFMGFFWNWYRTPTTQHDVARNEALLAAAQQSFAVLDRYLAGRAFLAGDRLTMGDIPVGAMLYRYFTLEIPRPSLPHL